MRQPSAGEDGEPGSSLDRANEKQIVERAKHDPSAFAELYERYFPRIYRFVMSRVRDETVAEDLTSEVFMKALAGIGRYRDRGWPFSSWLYQIAANTIVDRFRTLHPAEDIDRQFGLSDDTSLEEDATRRDDVRRIGSLVQALPAQQRTALVLKFQEDMAVEDIAAVMGKSRGAVRVIIHRAIATIRVQLHGAGYGEAGA
jgi:RNA polymerase sigma-70 factor (ECF subfamily)